MLERKKEEKDPDKRVGEVNEKDSRVTEKMRGDYKPVLVLVTKQFN